MAPDPPLGLAGHRLRLLVAGDALGQNPNETELEAIYAFPVPKHASLSGADHLARRARDPRRGAGEGARAPDLISGVKVFDATDEAFGKIYRGQQLVVFGRYERGGRATVTLKARMTGEDKAYTTAFDFPETDTRHPELERLWALERVETLEALERVGRLPVAEAEAAIRQLGVGYQLVTDHTSMVVLTDESLGARGIERRNRERVAVERQAQTARASQPAPSYRVDQAQPMFQNQPAPSVGTSRGGGAFDPVTAGLAAALAGLAIAARRRR